MAQYNTFEYNTKQYNATALVLNLFESITSTDANTKSDSALRQETLVLADNLFKLFNTAPFMTDFITATDVRLMQPAKSLPEMITISDVRLIAFFKLLPETITISDVRTALFSKSLQDFIILVDNLTKQITDKRLPMDTLRLTDWLEIRQNPQSDSWGN